MKFFKAINSSYMLVAVITLTIILASDSIFAQGGGGPIPPHVLPLDGGIGALIAAGVAAGVFLNKKLRKKS